MVSEMLRRGMDFPPEEAASPAVKQRRQRRRIPNNGSDVAPCDAGGFFSGGPALGQIPRCAHRCREREGRLASSPGPMQFPKSRNCAGAPVPLGSSASSARKSDDRQRRAYRRQF